MVSSDGPDSAARILGLAHVAAGLLVVAVGIPLALRRVRMNWLYGVRLPKAYESEANWYAINAYGGRIMAIAGGVIALLGLAILIWPPSSTAWIILLSFAPGPVILVALVAIVRFAGRFR